MRHKLVMWVAMLLIFTGCGTATTVAGGGGKKAEPADTKGVFQISATDAYLVGGEGDTGDSFRYDGSEIWFGPGQATVTVDDEANTGVAMGTVTTHGHTYTIIMRDFHGGKPFMDGGIARDLYLHGTTGHGPPVLPKVWTYVAGWGHADIYKDGKLWYENAHAHFMLTQGTRDKQTHTVDYPGPKQLMMAKKSGDPEKVREAKAALEEAEARAVNTHTQQLHIVAHSEKKNPNHFPPFEWFTHFMWDDVTWH